MSKEDNKGEIRDRATSVEDPNDGPAALRKKYEGQVGRKRFSADEIFRKGERSSFPSTGIASQLKSWKWFVEVFT